MRRLFLLVILFTFLSGCADRKPFCPEGFFGRTAIAPPATGTAKSSSSPYYAAAKQPSVEPRDTAQASTNTEPTNDPVASWKKADDSAASSSSINKRGTLSSWNLSQETPKFDPSVQHASHAEDVSTKAPERSRAISSTSPEADAKRWTTGRSSVSSARTCIEPPNFVHAPAISPPTATSPPVNNQPSASSQTPTHDSGSVAVNSSRQPVIRMLQPDAMASSIRPEPIDTSSSNLVPVAQEATSSQSHAPTQAPASMWHNSSSERPSASSTVVTKASHISTQPVTQREVVPSRVVNIADLPDPGTRARRQRRVDTNVRPASAFSVSRATNASIRPGPRIASQTTGTPTRAPVQAQNATTPSLRYGHGSAYGWLRGRLEYSEIAKRWKLRYIPIDGQADHYGGSVVLRNSTLLDNQREGDFVEVRGQLLAGENQDWGYAPIYEMAQLRPIGK